MQHSKLLETSVGLFVALGLVSLFFLAMQVSNLADVTGDARGYRVTARFQNVGSLKVRATVSMAGVRVGRVSAIRFDKESYEAVVDLTIDPQFDTIPSDTTASILTQGLLGEQYVGLSPGAESEYLKEGDKIDLTQSAMVLEQVISRFLFDKAENGDKRASETPEQTQVTPAAPVASPIPEAVVPGEGAIPDVQQESAPAGAIQ
ncbi:MAG: outer membrane lipid asymmetry maintenance protein MlaD [Methylococcaceae bacterium]|nr:outer membrane lipid asymmetry maintenance protein MlaD [Methylococcaceae bacterium]